jgi:hypothetical protein
MLKDRTKLGNVSNTYIIVEDMLNVAAVATSGPTVADVL